MMHSSVAVRLKLAEIAIGRLVSNRKPTIVGEMLELRRRLQAGEPIRAQVVDVAELERQAPEADRSGPRPQTWPPGWQGGP